MAFSLLAIGLLMLISSVRNTQDEVVALVEGDFTGRGNFFYWIVALLVVGAVGYIPKAKPVSDGLLVLILLSLFLTKGSPSYPGGGIFTQLTKALGATNQTQQPNLSSASGSSSGSTVGTILGDIGKIGVGILSFL